MITCYISQLRARSATGLWRSFGLNCASSQPSNLPSLINRRPTAGCDAIQVHRHFSKLSGKTQDAIDHSKFTHEVKVCMPDVGEGEDVKGVIETWYKKKGDLIKKDDVLCDIDTEMFTFGLCTDDDFDSIMGDILVPENSAPVAAGTVICTTLNEGHDDKSKPDDVEDCDLEGSLKKEGNEKKDI